MVVNFGNFTQVGDRNVALGGASGYDTEAIINALVEAKTLPRTALEETVEVTDSQITALSTLRSTVTSLQNSAELLRNPPGIDNAANNIFEYRTAFLSSNTSIAASTYVGISVEPGAELTKFDIEVEKVAEIQQSRSSLAVASKDTSLFASDTTFDIDDSSNALLATINVESGDTLEDVRNKINAVNGTTGVSAYILQVADNDFRLVLESDETGLSNAFNLDFTADAAVNTALGTITTAQAADDASFTLNGLAFTRESNIVTDVIDDITLSLFEATPDFGGGSPTTITAEITQNDDLIISAVEQFVTNYNNYRTFIAEQTERDADGAYVDTAVLSRNNTLNSIVRQIDAEVSRTIDGLTESPRELEDLGINLVDQVATEDQIAVSGILSINETILRNQLTSDPDAFRQVFEFQLTDSSSKIAVFDRTNELDVSSFSLDIDKSRGVGDMVVATYTDPSTSETVEYFANYTVSTDRTFSDDITENNMFGAATTDAVFNTGVTDGHRIRFALTDPDAVTTNFDFTFQTTITDTTTEFNSLASLATAISSQTGLDASIVGNTISINASDGLDSVAISNLDGTDFKGTLNIDDLEVIGGSITFDAKDRAISYDITSTSILGASDTTTNFSSGVTEGDRLVFNVTDADNSITTHTFTFDTTSPVAANGEFSNLSNLADAIAAQTGLDAIIYNNKLVISSENDTDAISFSYPDSTNFVTALNLDDIVTASSNSSALDGLELVYSGDGTDTGVNALSLAITQGIGDRFYNLIDSFTVDDGILDQDVDTLTDRQDSLESDIDRLTTQIESYRLLLLDTYSRLEQAVTAANSIIQLLEAQNNVANSD